MGVKNLKKFIREKYPNEIQRVNISNFYGKIFMMDIMSFIYKYKVTMREKWIQSIVHLIKLFKIHNIHVNIVLEGESPVEKNKEKEQRKKQRQQQEQKIKDIKNDINVYYETGKISDLLKDTYNKIKVSDTDKINHLLHFNKVNEQSNKDFTLNSKILEQIDDYILKKENQLVIITKQDIDKIKELCDSFGVPYFQSMNEAETLCCKMCKNIKNINNINNVDVNLENTRNQPIGVISEDSDVLAYGSNMLLCELNTSTGECNVIYLPSLLKTMDLSYQEFLEFCILCGTDYNNNIPSIGSVKCLEYIKKYKSIKNIFEHECKTIDKKIKDTIEKKLKTNKTNKTNKSNKEEEHYDEKDNEINDENNNENNYEINDDLTSEILLKQMLRSIEMFSFSDNINNNNNNENNNEKSKYWDTNINFNKVSECCLKYNINSNFIEKLWTNNIKLIK
jgi:hypothetical protein